MPGPDLRSIVAAAEQAAADGDFASAERLLREVAHEQETTLGPLHPDLANTLNNLGVLCEMAAKPVEAESCYRRASAIAAASLEPGHPFVATSRQNLEDFCRTRGIPLDPPAPAPPAVPPVAVRPPQTAAPHVPPPRPAPPTNTPPSQRSPSGISPTQLSPIRTPPPAPVESPSPAPAARSSRAPLIAVLVVGGLALAIFIASRFLNASTEPPQSSSISATPTPAVATPAVETPPVETPAVEPAPEPPPTPVPTTPPPVAPPAASTPATPPRVAPPARDIPGSRDTPIATREARTTGAAPSVTSAQLCRNSPAAAPGSAWQCDAASGTIAPGTLYFYTRVASASDVMVQHRWYRGDSLHQTIELRVRANQNGYRTFSRNTVSPERAGNWRVEVRAQDGTILHEERFVVQ